MRYPTPEEETMEDLLDRLLVLLEGYPCRWDPEQNRWVRDLTSASEKTLVEIFGLKGRLFALREKHWFRYRNLTE